MEASGMTVRHWISYDARDDQRSRWRRKWTWLLLLLLLLLAALVAALLLLASSDVADADLRAIIERDEPVTIQTALPALLVDNTMIVYVVDDSASMGDKLLPLHQALHEVAAKPIDNSEIALLMFGNTSQALFDFTEPDEADWDDAIPAFTASSGGTAMFMALAEALEMMPGQQVCRDESRFVFFNETVCRQNRIVLMSDGIANDAYVVNNVRQAYLTPAQEAKLLQEQFDIAESVIEQLVRSDVPVDTIALGIDADEEGLRLISNLTGGKFIEAYY